MESKRELALDTDKVTAIVWICVFLVAMFRSVVDGWGIISADFRLIPYDPIGLSFSTPAQMVESIAPLWMLWVATQVWPALDRLQRLAAVLWIAVLLTAAILRNFQLNNIVRASVSIAVTVIGLLCWLLIMFLIVRWFRSKVRYV